MCEARCWICVRILNSGSPRGRVVGFCRGLERVWVRCVFSGERCLSILGLVFFIQAYSVVPWGSQRYVEFVVVLGLLSAWCSLFPEGYFEQVCSVSCQVRRGSVFASILFSVATSESWFGYQVLRIPRSFWLAGSVDRVFSN